MADGLEVPSVSSRESGGAPGTRVADPRSPLRVRLARTHFLHGAHRSVLYTRSGLVVGGRALADARIQEVRRVPVAKIFARLRNIAWRSTAAALVRSFTLRGRRCMGLQLTITILSLFNIPHHRIERGVWAAGLIIGEPLKLAADAAIAINDVSSFSLHTSVGLR